MNGPSNEAPLVSAESAEHDGDRADCSAADDSDGGHGSDSDSDSGSSVAGPDYGDCDGDGEGDDECAQQVAAIGRPDIDGGMAMDDSGDWDANLSDNDDDGNGVGSKGILNALTASDISAAAGLFSPMQTQAQAAAHAYAHAGTNGAGGDAQVQTTPASTGSGVGVDVDMAGRLLQRASIDTGIGTARSTDGTSTSMAGRKSQTQTPARQQPRPPSPRSAAPLHNVQQQRQQQQRQNLHEVQAEQMHHLPSGLPDVQDRKRILGCLAGILAGMYSYDVYQHVDAGSGGAEANVAETNTTDTNTNTDTNARLSRLDSRPVYSDLDDSHCDTCIDDIDEDEDEDDNDNDVGLNMNANMNMNTKSRQQGSYDQAVVGAAPSVDDDGEEEEDDFYDDSFYGDDAVLTTSPTSRVANRMMMVRKDGHATCSRSPLAGGGGRGVRRAESAPALQQQQQQQQGRNAPGIPDHSLSMPPEKEKDQKLNQSKRHQPTPRSTTAAPSRLFPRRRQRHTTELAIRRHRVRRYEVMSELLSDAAECLGLEERDVKGFMIMLDSVKTGNLVPNGTNSGGAGRGGQSQQQQQNQKAGRGGRRRFGGERLRMEAEATQRSTGLMPIASSGTTSERPQMARDDSLNTSYTSGTVDVSGWGDNPGDSRSQQQLEQQDQRQEEQMQEQVPAYEASLEDDWTNPEMISPFLSDLTPGAGFQCVSLLLLQHLLRSKSGYDARARQVYKRLGVLVLMWEEKARYDVLLETETSDAGSGFASDAGSDAASEGVEIRTDASGEVLGIHHSPSAGEMSSTSFLTESGDMDRKRSLRPSNAELAAKATRKFESLERATASKLITLSNQQSSKRRKQKQPAEGSAMSEQRPSAEATSTPQEPARRQANDQRSRSASSGGHPQREMHEQEQPQQRGQRPKQHSQRQQRPHAASAPPSADTAVANSRTGPRITRKDIMRGLKVGSAGVAAGALFAITGSLAAPGIAAGIAAMTASTTITAAGAAVVSTLTSTAAVCTIFGVGGGGLAAYKVSRRTQGVTEFEFRREDNGRARVRAEKAANEARKAAAGSNLRRRLRGDVEHVAVAAAARAAAAQADAELFSTVCVSGWLRDEKDFQRPWGVEPNNPPITDLLEKLERFYAKYQPNKIHRCGRILAHWRGEERQLWRLLRQKYGRNPDETYPFEEGPRFDGDLTAVDDEAVDCLLRELGYDIPDRSRPATSTAAEQDDNSGGRAHRAGEAIGRLGQKIADKVIHHNYEGHGAKDLSRMENQPSLHPIGRGHGDGGGVEPPVPGTTAATSSNMRNAPTPAPMTAPAALSSQISNANPSAGAVAGGSSTTPTGASDVAAVAGGGDNTVQSLPRHLNTVWDYTSEYGGELYTVRWESDLLMELCDSVTDMVVDVLGAGTRELLKQTALATLVTAIAIPYAMVRAADSIDSVWTLAVERADDAGVELAKSLLDSQAGHRPVTLCGFSMGARAVYSCLKELARHQEKWEDQRDRRREEEETAAAAGTGDPSSSNSGEGSSSKATKSSNKKKSRGGGGGEEERVYSREPASIVEDVILMGCPNHVSIPSWEASRRIVSGRLVNCYSTKDLILSVLFQYKRMTGVLRPVCGCAPVKVAGVENYDITYMLNSHADYTLIVGDILRLVRHGQPRPTESLGWYGQQKQPQPAAAKPEPGKQQQQQQQQQGDGQNNVSTDDAGAGDGGTANNNNSEPMPSSPR